MAATRKANGYYLIELTLERRLVWLPREACVVCSTVATPARACAVVSAGLLAAQTPRGAELAARTLRGEQASADHRAGSARGAYPTAATEKN